MSEEQLLKEPRLQPLRKELLSLALDYYLKFINQRADDPSVRKELADAHNRAGDIYWETYTGPDEKVGSKRGKELLARGVALYEELVREKPGDRELRVGLAKSLIELTVVHWVEREYQAGLDSSNRAIELWEQLRTADPNNVEFERSLGTSYCHACACEKRHRRQGGARRRHPAGGGNLSEDAQNSHRTTKRLCGNSLSRTVVPTDWTFSWRAVRISRQLEESGKAACDPLAVRHHHYLTNALANAADKYAFDLGQPGKAEPLLQESVELVRERMRRSPESNECDLRLRNVPGEPG